MSLHKEEVFRTTIEETFERAAKAQISGDACLAEELYDQILKLDPENPEANHNLGLLALDDGRSHLALSALQKALRINPNKENFWLSYINALINEKKFNTAKVTIEQAKLAGISKDKLDALDDVIASLNSLSDLSKDQAKEFLKEWIKKNSTYGNAHLSIDEAACRSIPFSEDKAWLRPTFSDSARVTEFLNNIYFNKNWLHDVLLQIKPTVLIDVGANIGLSSLSLIKEFTSIKKVIAIEAEEKNHSLLNENFKLWSSKYVNIDWEALNAVATDSDETKIQQTKGLFDYKNGHSVSGTFKYAVADESVNSNQRLEKTLSMKSVLARIPKEERVIVKVDIEGGEEHLFKTNTEWMRRCLLVTCEIHDAFHPIMFNSSHNMLKALVEHNFAIVPSDDVIHCYNRNFINVEF